MKNILFISLLSLSTFSILAQQRGEKKVTIEINQRASYMEVNERYELLGDTIYYSNTGFLVFPDYDIIDIGGEDYVILSYPNFKNGQQYTTSKRSAIAPLAGTSPIHFDIVSKDENGKNHYINGKKLAMKKSDFEALNKTDHYSTSWNKRRNYDLTFGVLTVPFKLRPKIDSTNFNLTTDITLGPYFGITKRLSSSRRFYMTVPFTLGLSFINVNDSNTSNTTFDNDIGVVPGITWSSGLVFQLDDFNIGIVFGKDHASFIGEEWRYNGEYWYSFAIGYNFLAQD